jgi:PPM family protein phosphatase
MTSHASCPTFELTCAQISDMGMRRLNNQDAVAIIVAHDQAEWAARGHLLMVADGMGAHAAGELASKLAVDKIPHAYFKLRELHPPAAIRQAIREANRVIHAKGQSSISFQGMGTTCSCLVLLPEGALVAHIGDSRVYRLRGRVLEQLTFDHSLVWEIAAAGQIPEAEVPSYIPKNVITRSLGPHPNVNIDLEGPYNVAPGDVFLLCSDGLSGQVADEELGAILECLPPADAAQSLVDLANLRGGPDNITVVVARVAGESTAATDGGRHCRPEGTAQRRWGAAALWFASGVSLGIVAYCIAFQFWLGAAAASVAMLSTLVGAWAYRSAAAGVATGPLGGPYGNGPYRKVDCEPTRGVVDALGELADKLRELPNKRPEKWKVEWPSFDAALGRAAEAAAAGRLREALCEYCGGIRDLMQQLRDHRPTVEDSSGIHPSPP